MSEPVSRYAALSALAARYQALAAENYERTRTLAEGIRSGFCTYLNSDDPPCVMLAPPTGPFEPKAYGDDAFSVPPQGFRPLGPILFGLAVRVSGQGDWLRVVLECVKEGDRFIVDIQGGGEHRFRLPLHEQDPSEFFAALYAHLEAFFEGAIEDYEHGRYGSRDMGFDFSPRPAPEI
jgi:hypothetical protein